MWEKKIWSKNYNIHKQYVVDWLTLPKQKWLEEKVGKVHLGGRSFTNLSNKQIDKQDLWVIFLTWKTFAKKLSPHFLTRMDSHEKYNNLQKI